MAAETFRIEIPITVKDNTDPGVSSATRKMNGFDKQNEKTQKRLNEMNRTRYQVVLEALDKASSIINKVGTTVKGIAGKAWKITMSVIDKATAPIRGIFNLLKNPILQAGAVLGITVGLKDTIDTYGTFEATMSKVNAVSGATADQMERLTAKAKEMGATTKFTASEAGEAFTYMAMAGWDAEQMAAFLLPASRRSKSQDYRQLHLLQFHQPWRGEDAERSETQLLFLERHSTRRGHEEDAVHQTAPIPHPERDGRLHRKVA